MFVEIFATLPWCRLSPSYFPDFSLLVPVMAFVGAKSFKEQFLPPRNTCRQKDNIRYEENANYICAVCNKYIVLYSEALRVTGKYD